MAEKTLEAGYDLGDLEETVIPPVAEIDVVAPNIPLVVGSVVFVIVIA